MLRDDNVDGIRVLVIVGVKKEKAPFHVERRMIFVIIDDKVILARLFVALLYDLYLTRTGTGTMLCFGMMTMS